MGYNIERPDEFDELDPLFSSSHSPTDAEITEIIERFVQGELTNLEAEAAFERLRRAKKRALPVIMELCRSPEPKRYNTGVALILEMHLIQAKKPLRALIEDPTLEDEHKLSLLRVLETIGGLLPGENPLSYLRDPERLVQKAREMFFEVISDPLELTRLLEEQFESEGFPPLLDARILEEIASFRDRRASLFFQCLLHAPHDKVVLKAIECLRTLGDPDIIPALEERSLYDPSPQVRKAAQDAVRILADETQLREPSILHLPVTPPPIERCAISVIDGRGAQMCVLIWNMPEGGRVGTNILFTDEYGIQECIVLEGEESVAALEEALEHDFEESGVHVSMVEISLAQARAELERAYQTSLHAHRRLPPIYIALRNWLLGEDTRPITQYPLPQAQPEEMNILLQRSPELFQLAEFSSWLFDLPGSDVQWREYGRRFLKENSEEARAKLITQALRKVVDPELRVLIKKRLERQAWFLAQLYEEDDFPKMALAASAAMETTSEVPLVEHPFLREMTRQTLTLANLVSLSTLASRP
ncbi:MAG: HEAT repeat domain-containing protein [Anaerolineae bacterium]